jgi:4-hydroxy-3-methylbut-2-en-1-yl diphosphate synthase IspG/GcpE
VTINNCKPTKSYYILYLGKEGVPVLIAMKGIKIANIEIAETQTFEIRESITTASKQGSKTRLGVNSGSLGTKKRAEDIMLSVDCQSMILKEMRVIVHITRCTKKNTAYSILKIIDSRLEPTK